MTDSPTDLDLNCRKIYSISNELRQNNNKEYLTETQNKENGGPMLVDIDMRFPQEISERQYALDEISGILELYSESFQELFNLID